MSALKKKEGTGQAERMSSRVELYEDKLGEHKNLREACGASSGKELEVSLHANDFVDFARAG